MLNVAFGGSLIIDIPSDYDTTVAHRCEDYLTCFHSVDIDSGSMLSQISGINDGTVNTNHHQGIKVLSSQLKVVAYASDGLPEAVEWINPSGKPFLLGVQYNYLSLDVIREDLMYVQKTGRLSAQRRSVVHDFKAYFTCCRIQIRH